MVRLVTVAAVVLGVLIVGGTGLLISLVVMRHAAPVAAPATAVPAARLDEPPGTRIVAASGGTEGLVLVLQGGGPDRVVVLDPRTGTVAARAGLAR